MKAEKSKSAIAIVKKCLYLIILIFAVSCSPGKKELFNITDSFVTSLQTTYNSYGVLGGMDDIKITSDSLYQVMPSGRLINVKILKVVSDDVYKALQEDLKNHYSNDKRVNDVYISNGGTIMIDCRN